MKLIRNRQGLPCKACGVLLSKAWRWIHDTRGRKVIGCNTCSTRHIRGGDFYMTSLDRARLLNRRIDSTRAMCRTSEGVGRIAKQLGVTRATVYRRMKTRVKA